MAVFYGNRSGQAYRNHATLSRILTVDGDEIAGANARNVNFLLKGATILKADMCRALIVWARLKKWAEIRQGACSTGIEP